MAREVQSVQTDAEPAEVSRAATSDCSYPVAAELRSIFVKATGCTPWVHQVGAVERLLQLLLLGSRSVTRPKHFGQNYLVQHGTGSGKSWTMALLAWALSKVRDVHGRRFALVLLISDRVQLDRQLGTACSSFLAKAGVASNQVRRFDGNSMQLTKVLGDVADGCCCSGCCLILSTKQLFDSLFKDSVSGAHGMLAPPILRHGRVAIICEEAHRSHFVGNTTMGTVNKVFGDHAMYKLAARRGMQPCDVSYIGFTGTPDERTLEFFGSCDDLGDSGQLYHPTHAYNLGKADADGVVIDVLENYASVEAPGGLAERAKWILHDFAMKQASFQEPFRSQCKAMIICKSREHVAQYVNSLRAVAWKQPDMPGASGTCFGIYGFFSGAIGDELLEETQLNVGLPLHAACARARVIVVCRKLETGYDDPTLAVMYIDRHLADPKQVVQVMSRVNRRAQAKRTAYIVDFCNERSTVENAFAGYRQDASHCTLRGKNAAAVRFAATVENLEALLKGCAQPESVAACFDEYGQLCEELGIPTQHRLADLVCAISRHVAANGNTTGEVVFVEEHIAKRLLGHIVPSGRYGGLGLLGGREHTVRLRASLEQGFRAAMGPPEQP